MEQKQPPKLKDQLFAKCQVMGRSPSTAIAYWNACEKYLRFHYRKHERWIHPKDMGTPEIEEFLTHLAVILHVSPGTQNQNLQGILFLYHQVLKIEIRGVNALRAKKPTFIPTVLSVEEVLALLDKLTGRNRLIAYLCYGCGMRIGEVFELRVKDIDFGNNFVHIRQAKGHKDRIVQLPNVARSLLRQQIEETERLHARDMRDGCARVPLPFAFERKCPRAAQDLGWWWVFCSHHHSFDKETGRKGRWHIDPTTFTKILADAVREAKIYKRVTAHSLRHSYATHLMNNRVPLREIQELMGHSDISTTQIYLHVEQQSVSSIKSPLDRLRIA